MTGLYRFHILLCARCGEPFSIVHDRPHPGKETILAGVLCPGCAMTAVKVSPDTIREVQAQVTSAFMQAFSGQIGLGWSTYSSAKKEPWPRKKKDGTE